LLLIFNMQKYAAILSYSGTRFCGWQEQRGPDSGNTPSVQETIQDAVHRMTGEKVSIVGSGRTDSGVHAVGQVAHFVLRERDWDPRILFRGLNSILRPSIQLVEVRKVPIEFHAQRSAVKKQYSYFFQQGPCALPHLEPFSWWIYKTLDQDAMREAVSYLVGEHDFKPFQAKGAKVGTTVRKILEAEVVYEPLQFPHFSSPGGDPFGFVRVRLMGTGFLKQMVRGIAGTLLEIGEGRRPATDMRDILVSMDRSEVGRTAPGRGLWLERVWYPVELWGGLE
jgi:tRNA pseudouridine38-40 synthase